MKYRKQFSDEPFVLKGEDNDGVRHPDFDPDVVTSIVDYYMRFAADPDFKVTQLPAVYDDPSIKDDQLVDLDEPELGEQDIEYFGNPDIVERAKNSKRAMKTNQVPENNSESPKKE